MFAIFDNKEHFNKRFFLSVGQAEDQSGRKYTHPNRAFLRSCPQLTARHFTKLKPFALKFLPCPLFVSKNNILF
jgi:hypothetical protein